MDKDASMRGHKPSVLQKLRRSVTKRTAKIRLSPIARAVLEAKLSYVGAERMASLLHERRRLDRLGVAGDLVEFGVALGGTAIVLAAGANGRRFTGYDVLA